MNRHLALLLSPAYPGALAPAHRADLERSGLTETTIRAQRFMSVPPHMIRPLLGWDSACIRSAMLLPFADPAGAWMDHVKLRLSRQAACGRPRPERCALHRPARPMKYAQPRRAPNRLYFPRAVLPVVLDATAPLLVVEGEKKALAVAQEGRAAVGIGGVWSWREPRTRRLLPDFDQLPLTGRRVELVPDGDVQTNGAVAEAVEACARALERRFARVAVVLLPAVA